METEPLLAICASLAGLTLMRAGRGRGALTIVILLAGIALTSAAILDGGRSPFSVGAVKGLTFAESAWRFTLVVWWVLVARLSAILLALTVSVDRRSRGARLSSDLLAALAYAGCALLVLSIVFHLPITGLLATSGVLAIVLGLALQSTLADVFAGIAVGLEQSFHVGDYVALSERLEGRIVEANWRAVHVRTEEGNLAIVPNSVVSRGSVINHSRPRDQLRGKVEVRCSALAPHASVIALLSEAALMCPEIVCPPAVRLTRVGRNRNVYAIVFATAGDLWLSRTKSDLLGQSLRFLFHAGHGAADGAVGPGEGPSPSWLLRRTILFEALPDGHIDALAGLVSSRHLDPGENLFEQGGTDPSLYVVAAGVLEVSRTVEGVAGVLGRIGPGEYLGEFALLTGEPHQASARAVTRSHVLVLGPEAVAPLIERSPEIVPAFERSMLRGLEIIHRDSAARDRRTEPAHGSLLAAIQAFFRR